MEKYQIIKLEKGQILNIIIAIIASRESLQNSVLNANQVLPKINIANDHSSPQS
jgi:hypothetical protein